MSTDQHESLGMPPLREGSVGITGVVQRRATRFRGSQNPSHGRNISILNNTIQTITLVSNAVPLPTVKGVLLAVAGILSITKNAIANRDDFKEIIETCQRISRVLQRVTSQTPEQQLDGAVHGALIELKSSLDAIQDAAKAKTEKNLVSKIVHITINQETIVKMKDDLNRFLTIFNTKVIMSTSMKVDKTKVKVDETKVKVDETKVKVDETKMKVDETKVTVDETKVTVDETKVTVDETKVTVDETKVKVDETKVKVDKMDMKVEEFCAEFHTAGTTRISNISQMYAPTNVHEDWAHLFCRDSGEPDVLPSQPGVFFGRDN